MKDSDLRRLCVVLPGSCQRTSLQVDKCFYNQFTAFNCKLLK